MKAKGWAVIDREGISVPSVSPTRRAAIINWLIAVENRHITNATSDDYIERVWDAYQREATVVEVVILASTN